MKKRMIIMLVILAVLFGSIFLGKMLKGWLKYQEMTAMEPKGVTVSTMMVKSQPWQSKINAVGTLRAVTGVDVTTELQGMVKEIYFQPGSFVEKETVLVQLKDNTERSQLKALQAQLELAKITYKRDKAQYAIKAVSKQTVDTDEWNVKNLQAQVAEQESTVQKKAIKAPFSGRVGIVNVNPGQFINPGDKITTLQTLHPIYVDFYLPQQDIAELRVGQKVTLKTDTFPKLTFVGKITTIEPIVNTETRNVQVEAEIDNQAMKLIPGMFASVEVTVGQPQSFLTLPQTAISFNPYGEIAYIVKKTDDQLIAKQVFVTTGKTRGDQIQVLTGLKAGDVVVTSGQLKLKNDTPVIINNQIQPLNEASPTVSNYS